MVYLVCTEVSKNGNSFYSGYIENKGMGDFLIDIGVSDWCQWPSLVIAALDPNDDGKLSFEEISSILFWGLHTGSDKLDL